jgi:ribosomal protein S18 acetylase RimI-like enzyme
MTAMTTLPIDFRPARPEDAGVAAALMHDTMASLGMYVFGQPGPEETVRFLERIFPMEGHRFSAGFTTLAEISGRTVGLLQAIPGDRLVAVTIELLHAVRRAFGWRTAFGLIRRGLPLAGEPDAENGEYYIECLSVAPEFRNRGIGRSLLQEAEVQARQQGFQVCSLGVLLENGAARRLYERVGYRVERKVISRLTAPAAGYAGFYRMVKHLDSAAV